MLDFNKLYPKKRNVSGEKVPGTEPIRDAVQEGRSGQRSDTVEGTEDSRADRFREQIDSDSAVNRKLVVEFDEMSQPPMTAEQKKRLGTSSANKSNPRFVARREYIFTTGATATFTDYSRDGTIINEGDFSNKQAQAQVEAFEKKGAKVSPRNLDAGRTRTDDQNERPVKRTSKRFGFSGDVPEGLDPEKVEEFTTGRTSSLDPDASFKVSEADGRPSLRGRTPSPLQRPTIRPGAVDKDTGAERDRDRRKRLRDARTLGPDKIFRRDNNPSSKPGKRRSPSKRPKAPEKKFFNAKGKEAGTFTTGPTPIGFMQSISEQIKQGGNAGNPVLEIAAREYELEEKVIPRLRRELAAELSKSRDPGRRSEGERRQLSEAFKESDPTLVDGRGGEGAKNYSRTFEAQRDQSLTGPAAAKRDELNKAIQELKMIGTGGDVQLGDRSSLMSGASTSGMGSEERVDGSIDDSNDPRSRRGSTTLTPEQLARIANSPARRPHPVVALAQAGALRDMRQPGLSLGSEDRRGFDSAARENNPRLRDEQRAMGLADIRDQQRASRSPGSTEASPTSRRARGRASDPTRELSLLMGQIGQSSDPRGNKGLVKAVYEGLIEEGYSRNEALELISNQIRGGGNDMSMPEINEPSYSRGSRDDSLRSLMGRGEMDPVVGNQRSIKRPDASTMRANFGLPSRMPSQKNETRMLSQLINSGIDPEDAKKFILKLLRRGR